MTMLRCRLYFLEPGVEKAIRATYSREAAGALKSMADDDDGILPTSASRWGSNAVTVVAHRFEDVGWTDAFDGCLAGCIFRSVIFID